MVETCSNCGEPIGTLEPAMVWNDHTVCGRCWHKLRPKLPLNPLPEKLSEADVVLSPLEQLAQARASDHTPQRRPRAPMMPSILIGLGIAVLVVGVVAGIQATLPKTRLVDPNRMMDAGDLLGLYHQNEIRADQVFKGRIVLVQGSVSSVNETFGSLYVHLAPTTGGLLWTVQCDFPESARLRLANLRTGEVVRVDGRCEGMLIGSVVLRDCEIH